MGTDDKVKRNDDTPPELSANRPPVNQEEHSAVVYRRIEATDRVNPPRPAVATKRFWSQTLAPTVMPLFVGFLLLLILISVLGFLSVRSMDDVSVTVRGLEQQHAAKLSLLLKLRLDVTKLNNEARARADSESRRELRPPFDVRLATARDDMKQLTRELDGPLLNDPAWQKFKTDLESYIEVTKDLRRYSLEGFDKFGIVDRQLDAFLARIAEEQHEVFRQSEIIEQDAASSIRFWSVVALIVGGLVAAGTIWEVQRRFGEMLRSVEEARRERVFTGQLLEGMVSAVAAIDHDDHIRSANAAFFRIFPGASIGAAIHERIGPEPALKMLDAVASSRVDKSTYRGRWVVPSHEHGSQNLSFDVYSSPLAIDSARGQIVTLVDVTEAAEAERGLRRQESLAAMGQATAQVAHEIRNPLGSIRLGVSMLRDNITDPEGLHTLDLVERSIKHLNKLVVDVAQFSRSKALERSDVELREVINRSLELLADKVRENNTRIEQKHHEDHLVGHWDPDQLRQVFVNIIANAIDASPKGGVVEISTQAAFPPAGEGTAARKHARITIADQGKGMDLSSLERMFEPFFSTKKRGTGLGLAIVKQIVDQHGGHLKVDSKPGAGTRFVIELPV